MSAHPSSPLDIHPSAAQLEDPARSTVTQLADHRRRLPMDDRRDRRRDDEFDFDELDDAGQATAEYALVLLGAALVALLLIGWATAGGGAGKIGHLLDHVLDTITSKL